MAIVASTIVAFAAIAHAPPASADGLVSVDQYVAQTQGAPVGNGQCAVLVQDYLRKVYGVSTSFGGDQGAYRYGPGWEGGAQLQNAGFSWSTSSSDLQDGDVLVWSGGFGGYGHTAIWYHGRVYDQNSLWPGRKTTSGAAIGAPSYAALETFGTPYMLNNTGQSISQPYVGRWRKTPPVVGGAGSAPNPVGSGGSANTYPTFTAANIRTGPTLASSIIQRVANGTRLTIDCYAKGDVVGGTAIWNHVPALGGYVSDSVLLTGSNSAVVPLCTTNGASGQHTWANATVYRLSTNYQSGTYGTAIATLGNDSSINIDCWVVGQGVSAQTSGGSTYTDYVWYHLPSYPGWISDARVRTTTDNSTVGQFGPRCPQGTIQGPFPVIGTTPVYGSAHTSAGQVTSLGNGSKVSIDCTTTGDQVTNGGTSQTSTLWDHLTGVGYIPDVYILTGVNSEVAPPCHVASLSPDVTRVAGSAPTISGTVKVGKTLTANTGTWAANTSLTYAWSVPGTEHVLGRTKTLRVPGSAAGKKLIVTVVGSKSTYRSTSKSSGVTSAVKLGVIHNTTAPSITGTRKVGYSLTAKVGSWTPGGLTFRYQWYRNTSAIKGATARTYKLPRSVRGATIRVRIVASRTGYARLAKYSGTTSAIR